MFLSEEKRIMKNKTQFFEIVKEIWRQKTCEFSLPQNFFSLVKNYPNPEIRDNPHGHQ